MPAKKEIYVGDKNFDALRCPDCGSGLQFDTSGIELSGYDDLGMSLPMYCEECGWEGTLSCTCQIETLTSWR